MKNNDNQDYQIILHEILIKKSHDSAQLMLITRLLLLALKQSLIKSGFHDESYNELSQMPLKT